MPLINPKRLDRKPRISFLDGRSLSAVNPVEFTLIVGLIQEAESEMALPYSNASFPKSFIQDFPSEYTTSKGDLFNPPPAGQNQEFPKGWISFTHRRLLMFKSAISLQTLCLW